MAILVVILFGGKSTLVWLFLWVQILSLSLICVFWLILLWFKFDGYLPRPITNVLEICSELIIFSFPIILVIDIFLIVVLLYIEGDFYLYAKLAELLPRIIDWCHISVTKKSLILYLLIILPHFIAVCLLFIDYDMSLLWSSYFGWYILFICIEFWSLFTDLFFITCIGHLLLYCTLFLIIFFSLGWHKGVKVHVFSWIWFFCGIALISTAVWWLYSLTGTIWWSTSQGINIPGVELNSIQHCFYFGVLLPIGLFPASYWSLCNCKTLPISFRFFFNSAFYVHSFYMVMFIYEVFGGTGFNYQLFIILCVTISTITVCLYFETDFMGMVSLSAMLHTHFLLVIYILDNTTIQNGLVCDIWIQIVCISGLIIILSMYNRYYGEKITLAISGIFYKYPLIVLVNITLVGLLENVTSKFVWQVYLDFTWTSENMLFFSILSVLVICISSYWVIMAWRWWCLWFKVPKSPDIENPNTDDEWEVVILVCLILVLILSFFYPVIFYF